MGDTIWSIVAAIGGFGVVGVVFYYWALGDRERVTEEDARHYYDEHGYWPDETPYAVGGSRPRD
jgi:hypothetical protein